MVAEQRADADAEEGSHDEEEQDVELGVRVREHFLHEWEEIRAADSHSNKLFDIIYFDSFFIKSIVVLVDLHEEEHLHLIF